VEREQEKFFYFSFSPFTMSTLHNPWFAISLGLVGLITGYSLGNAVVQAPAGAVVAPTQVAQAPSQPSQQPPPPPPPAGPVKPVDKADHVRGNPDAVVSIIEYSDYECPFCKRVHPTLTQLLADYDGKVNWVYRHYPLGFHPNAKPAAKAGECVNELGGNDAFWAFTDKIFETQGEWAYEKYVEELGLDGQAFKDCFESGKYDDHIQQDFDEGSAAGVSGTPGNIVLNNKTQDAKSVSGAQPAANFKTAIDALLKS